jgi:hypothetical protein
MLESRSHVPPRLSKTRSPWRMTEGHLLRLVYCKDRACLRTKYSAISCIRSSEGAAPEVQIIDSEDNSKLCLHIKLSGSLCHPLAARVDKELQKYPCTSNRANSWYQQNNNQHTLPTLNTIDHTSSHEQHSIKPLDEPQSNNTIKKSGWLLKLDRGDRWLLRWFVLQNGKFIYYKQPEATESRGSFDLSKAKVALSHGLLHRHVNSGKRSLKNKKVAVDVSDGYYIEIKDAEYQSKPLNGAFSSMRTIFKDIYTRIRQKKRREIIILKVNNKDTLQEWYLAIKESISNLEPLIKHPLSPVA